MATEYEQVALQNGACVPTGDFWSRVPGIDRWHFMEECRSKYGWCIPSEEALTAIREYGPFLEIGSGNGYWAYEMAKRGIDITPTDKNPMDPHWFKPPLRKQWYPVFKTDAVQAVETYDRPGLLLCWPSYSESWAYDALLKFRGKYVVYVGEGYGGCTADDKFHQELNNWEEVLDIAIPQWWGLHDRLWVYVKKEVPEPSQVEDPNLQDRRRVLWDK